MEEFGSAERIEFRLVLLNSSFVVAKREKASYNIILNRPQSGRHVWNDR